MRRLGLVVLSTWAGVVLSAGTARAAYVGNKYTEPGTGAVLEYNVFVPTGYNPAIKYPLMVVMHAAGGTLPRTLSSSGTGWAATFVGSPHQTRDPSFFLIPISQTDASGWGEATNPITATQKFEGRLTVVVLKEVLTRYNIDPNRLYVTGPSMGGRGTWDLIRRHPTLFAAAAPMAAPALAADAALYATQNIWATNGENDSTVQANRDAIAAIRRVGGNPIYTELANHGHDTWRTVYPDPQFLDWMYAQRLGVPWTEVSKAPVIAGLTGPAVIAPTGGTGSGGSAGTAGNSGNGGAAAGGRGGATGAAGQSGASTGGAVGQAGRGGDTGVTGGANSPGSGGSGGGALGSGGTPPSASGGAPPTSGGTSSGGQSTSGAATGGSSGGGNTGGTSASGGARGPEVVSDGSVGCSLSPGRTNHSWPWVATSVLLGAFVVAGRRRAERNRQD